MDFSNTLTQLRKKAGTSRYKMAQWTGLSETYLFRLEKGERLKPSRDVVIMLAMALAFDSKNIDIFDVEELLLSADYAPLRRRGETEMMVSPALIPLK